MAIRVLPDEVATRIAAGEVVERPASVIKELLENAIDAGAKEIRLEVHGGGLRRMRVQDDGCGISADEVELAFARHSTSKLASVDDLDHIKTLGFRGEALASIASVARVTLVTRAADEQVGTLLRLEGGQIKAREPSGRPTGTALTVDDLFFNVPARRKFLRTERTERRHIDNLVTRYAMAYPRLRFALTNDGRASFQSNGSGDLREVLLSVYGTTTAAQMIHVDSESAAPHPIGIRGYVSAPSLHRSNRNEITLFVNGRWVQDHRLTYAVTQAYHTLLMTKRYPLAVLEIDIPPEDVDVNVHPAKTEVRFRDADAVFRALQRAVRRALVDQSPVPEFRVPRGEEDTPSSELRTTGNWPGAWPTPEQLARRARLRALRPQPGHHPERLPDSQFAFDLGRSALDTLVAADSPFEKAPPSVPTNDTRDRQASVDVISGKNRMPYLRVVGQLGLTYIVAEGPDGMFLIDQHAAHERVLYEKMLAEKAQSRVPSQLLLEPITVELTPEGFSLIEESLPALLELGFDIEAFGGNTVLVRAVPTILVNKNVQRVFDEIVADLQVGDDPMMSQEEAQIISHICKQAAIRAGQTLSSQEMEELVRQLEGSASPRTCPHGRPTMIHLSAVQLAQEFGRLG